MMKGEVRRKLRRWRISGEGEKKYKERRGNYKMCERKKQEKNERWESKAEEARRESELWEIVNRERKRGKGINENMKMEEWKDYFRGLLRGIEGGWKGEGGREQEEKEEEEGLFRKEIMEVLRGLKDKKATGMDGEEEIEEWV